MKHRESSLQSSCVKWFRMAYPKYAKRLIAIPNGGQRNRITGAILKREGVLAGVPDLFLAVPVVEDSGIKWPGLWIEMKAAKGKLSVSQKEMIEEFGGDYRVNVCFTFEEFKNCVEEYLKIK